MKRLLSLLTLLLLLAGCAAGESPAVPCVLDMDPAHGTEVSPLLWGLFLEDINHAVDGGLYAELVKNGSFEFGPKAAMANKHGWQAEEGVSFRVEEGAPFALHPANPHYAVIYNAGSREAGILGCGWLDGMAVTAGARYRFSFFACSGACSRASVALVDTAGTVYAEAEIEGIHENMQSLETVLVPRESCSRNLRLAIRVAPGDELWLDMVSLMPEDTFAGLPVRKDLGELLAALHPAFLRFPGGCAVEGRSEESIYSWKDSIGGGEAFVLYGADLGTGHHALRPQGLDIWNGTATHPYYTSYGLGFYEYFCLCEALDCIPVPVLNAGMTCPIQSSRYIVYRMNTPEFRQCVQDALDLVEFCRGGADTRWGAVRIAMGHPEPFPLPYLAIGNEQWQREYFEHYLAFVEALAAAAEDQPEIYGGTSLIVANGPSSASWEGWDYVDGYCPWDDPLTALVDEHYYEDPDWFLANTHRYDSYDRSLAARVFLGEYASRTNLWRSALAEAAFMTGLERNGDVVAMACYAPLLGNGTDCQWTPDLIFFTGTDAWGTVNYQVQKLFMNHPVARTLPLTLEAGGVEASAGLSPSGALVVKWVNTTGAPVTLSLTGPDPADWAEEGVLTLLSADTLAAVNTREDPLRVAPVEQTLAVGPETRVTLPPRSVAVFTLSPLPARP